MEDNKQAIKNEGQAEGKVRTPRGQGGDICISPATNPWRRVLNKTLGCYEIYVRKSNVLVATGIGNTGDSFLIGALPVIMDTYAKLIKEIENGEVKEETFRGAKYTLDKFKENLRKGEGMDRGGVLRLDSPEFDLGGQGGGSHTEAGLFD
jgi:hypothetical protein